MVIVNGVGLDIAGKTLQEYLESAGYNFKQIAVERNGSVVFKSLYATTILCDNDTIEIVCFVGGG
ncbi:MAG: sulfur carrier protein ThiS [Burkholderiaceae bacterium]|nr:sulfur carrier protein ThiS [Burkholderiaceae bacterium]